MTAIRSNGLWAVTANGRTVHAHTLAYAMYLAGVTKP